MFGLSFFELAVVMVIALIVLGPERLPKLARTLGKAMREVRKVSGDFKDLVEGELRGLDEEVARMPGERGAGKSAEFAAAGTSRALPIATVARASGAVEAGGVARGIGGGEGESEREFLKGEAEGPGPIFHAAVSPLEGGARLEGGASVGDEASKRQDRATAGGIDALEAESGERPQAPAAVEASDSDVASAGDGSSEQPVPTTIR